MTERELENRLRVRYGTRPDDGAPAALRTSVAAIPDTVMVPGWDIRGRNPTQRPLALVAAMLLLAAALAGGIAVGSGLIRLPWQHSNLIDPAGIAPCELVSGELVSGGTPLTDEGVWPPDNVPDNPYQAGYVNRLLDLELSRVSGRTCSFPQQPNGTGRMNPYRFLLFRSQATTGAEARQLAATIFTVGPSPFDQGPVGEQIGGHRAWVGILGERKPMVGHPWWEEFIPRMAVAVSAEPYFFVVTFHINEAILGLSDAAWEKWWEREWESTFWPGIRTPVEEILSRLAQMERTATETKH